ncbi:MAG TPA: hypothetical protein VHV83_15355 [Armatimonadota bacterium]|nr:hypothetical protein [Armatimonadota bacterium]
MTEDRGSSYPSNRDIREQKSQGEERVEQERKESSLKITRDTTWDIETTPEEEKRDQRKSA